MFWTVVWCFLRNGNVMGMILSDTCGRNFNEPGFPPQFVDRSSAAVTHACTQPADQLINKIGLARLLNGTRPSTPSGTNLSKFACPVCRYRSLDPFTIAPKEPIPR